MMSSKPYWLPSVYLMQGIPYALITVVSPVLYKKLGFSNTEITFFTSLLTLPWVFKIVVAPLLEHIAGQRTWAILAEVTLGLLVLMIAGAVFLDKVLYWTAGIFFLIALVGAVHDINVDGLYLTRLNPHDQARFIGIRTLFYQLGKFFCQGVLLIGAGMFMTRLDEKTTWAMIFIILAISIILLSVCSYYRVPRAIEKIHERSIATAYNHVWLALKKQPHVFAVLLFIFIYNVPESQLIKIVPLFMLDGVNKGGLGLSLEQLGTILGGIGLIGMLIGVTLSGFLLSQFTLKKCLLPFTLFAFIMNLGYVLLTLVLPANVMLVAICVFAAQFGFGLSNGAYMFYLVHAFAKSDYGMSLYALGTAIMLLGIMLGGSISGYLQGLFGYFYFFIGNAVFGLLVTGIVLDHVRRVL